MADGQITTVDERESALAVQDQPMSLVERAALDPSIDLDRLERLIQMEQVSKERKAKEAYMKAMAEAQAEMPRVLKNKDNTHTKSKYSDLAAVDAAMKPVITKYGFSLSFNTVATEQKGFVRVGVTVAHKDGHETYHEDDFPLDDSGAKGNSNKTGIQAWGSTVTYARRYMKLMVFDVATSEDNDGNAQPQPVQMIGLEEMKTLDDLLEQSGVDRKEFLAYAKAEGMGDIKQQNFKHLKGVLESRLPKESAQ